MKNVLFRCSWVLVLLGFAACGERGSHSQAVPTASQAGSSGAIAAQTPPYVEVGDMDALQARGILRILVHRNMEGYLPREGHPQSLVEQGLSRFAEQHGMTATLVAVANFNDLL